jgi:hypothetical protein
MGILPEPPFNFRQNCDHQPKSGNYCLKSPFNLWPELVQRADLCSCFGPAVWPRTLAHTNNSSMRQNDAPNLTSDSAHIK